MMRSTATLLIGRRMDSPVASDPFGLRRAMVALRARRGVLTRGHHLGGGCRPLPRGASEAYLPKQDAWPHGYAKAADPSARLRGEGKEWRALRTWSASAVGLPVPPRGAMNQLRLPCRVVRGGDLVVRGADRRVLKQRGTHSRMSVVTTESGNTSEACS